MSAILAISSNSADGLWANRLDASLSSLDTRGGRRRTAEIPGGLVAAVYPEPDVSCPIPGADLVEENGVVAACHGSLYDVEDLYRAMGRGVPDSIERHPAKAVLDAYVRWGQGAPRYWTGEASFAVWDPRQRLLIAGRDHLGTRPLFYCRGGPLIAISTDIRSLLALSGHSPEPDPVVMRRFLCQGFFHNERTFFLHVNRIRPGSMVMARKGRLAEFKYWRLEDAEPVRHEDPEDYGRQFVEILSGAIKRRHVASPAFGSSLSGGLDSSSMVCLCHELRKKSGGDPGIPVSAVVFTGSNYDESKYVNAVAEKCHTLGAVTSPEYWDIFDEWERLSVFHDEPAIAMSVVIFWIQKALARDLGIRVQLSGAGADEVLAGELHYFADLLRRGRFHKLAVEIGGYAKVNSMGHSRGPAALFMRYALSPLLPLSVRGLRRVLSQRERYPWLGPALARLPREREPNPAPEFKDILHREMAYTLQSRYTPLLLHYEDRNSGAAGVESRFPFLDLDLVRFCYGLPREELMAAGHAKIVLKRGMKGILPDAVWRRQAKSGIPALITRWLTRDYRPRLSAWIKDMRLVADGWLKGPEIMELYERYAAGDHSLRRSFWRVVALEGWYRNYWP